MKPIALPHEGATASPTRNSVPHTPILKEGRNFWRRAKADRAALLVDGCNYFAELAAAIRKAKRSILILGWDFDGALVPCRGDHQAASLGDVLRRQVEAEPELEVRILVWSVAVMHAPSNPQELLWGGTWQHHPRIQIRLDTTHPIYAAHHQKICCIDGALGFLGGMDLTIDRWDTSEHLATDPRRRCPDGRSYGPVHDLQMMLEGKVVQDICTLAAKRWREATGEDIDALACGGSLWPNARVPDFKNVAIAISRAMPVWGKREDLSEAPRLTIDALSAARRSIFIETQYLAAPFVSDILERHLRTPGGPEIVCVVSEATHSRMERLLMGENRDRMVRKLSRIDTQNRFRVYHPVAPCADDEAGCPILVHSKLIIVDGRFLRIGSSNLNNRSTGLDSEIDLAIEASTEAERQAILSIRHRLIGEHMGVPIEQVERTVAQLGSLIAAIDRLNTGKRRLKPCAALGTAGPTRPVWFTSLLDPSRPFEPDWLLRLKPLARPR